MSGESRTSERFYRVDRFVVPDHAREEYLQKARMTHDLLKTQPGFIQDFVLEHSSGGSEFNFVTIVEWESPEAIEAARFQVAAMHRRIGFNPSEMFARLGIKTDLANYTPVKR
ncbi:MAG TPA: antibiotic biosynthesis monooxygenase [Alphaproteobacteria bacterium]|nr:antibiotic biosynthesis monooxygenase [Alphaproteobacteria bacterium]